jgi:benzoyl-CoA reductase subunit C
MTTIKKGLCRARDLYENRVATAKGFQKEGRKVIGYPCAYVPLELLTALDIVPHRLYGELKEPITEADRVLPASFCPVMRSCLDCVLKGKTEFLDGVAAIHSCDPQEKAARVWEAYTKYPYFHFIDMPIALWADSLAYFQAQLKDFRITLESFAGKKITAEGLQDAVELHNRQRMLVRELYELTKPDPPLISGAEIVLITKAVMSVPVTEGNGLLEEVLQEVRGRRNPLKKKSARLLLWTSTLDDVDVMELIEDKAHVVIDDNCAGIRPFRGLVKKTDNPLEALAEFYLKGITCARTFKQSSLGETRKDFAADLQSRFGFLKDRAENWKVDGALLFLVRYCDPFAFEMLELKDYFDRTGIPSTYIEYDYTQGGLAPIRTRVEAFLETLG